MEKLELKKDADGRVSPVDYNLAKSFRCAAAGIAHTVRGRNFKIEIGFGFAAVALGFAFSVSPAEWLAIIVCIGLVLSLEVLNDAIEAAVDLIVQEYHPLAKVAKDAGAGATLIASLASFAVGVIIFLPRILVLLGLM